jgi:(p)ppGpp synthase/HD superfamily hydrolase
MTETERIEYSKATGIAVTAHRGQKDRGGKDYYLHPLRVADRCENAKEKIVAVLHDVIEDTEYTADKLREEGFSEEIVEAVLSVTRQDGETYMDFIKRAACNPIGKVVKIADLEDNMDITRLPELTDRDLSRLKRYHKAWLYLKHVDDYEEVK